MWRPLKEWSHERPRRIGERQKLLKAIELQQTLLDVLSDKIVEPFHGDGQPLSPWRALVQQV